jgi:transposase-like protein
VGQAVLRRALGGSSCRSYEDEQATAVGSASKSTASREFVAASSTTLKTLQDRDLSSLDVVAVFLDGKYFADEIMVLAVGVTIDGSKVFLGFVETGTENARALSDFLRSLRSRGSDVSKGLLVVMDGSKGLRSAVKTVFDKQAVVQRCQWHKRENVVSHMPKKRQQSLRTRLQKAYERPQPRRRPMRPFWSSSTSSRQPISRHTRASVKGLKRRSRCTDSACSPPSASPSRPPTASSR